MVKPKKGMNITGKKRLRIYMPKQVGTKRYRRVPPYEHPTTEEDPGTYFDYTLSKTIRPYREDATAYKALEDAMEASYLRRLAQDFDNNIRNK